MASHRTASNADASGDDPLSRERALSTDQVAELTGLAPITLYQMRARGEGPRFFRAGARNIRYRLGDVLDWRDARTVGKR